jgi:hypothetical protein
MKDVRQLKEGKKSQQYPYSYKSAHINQHVTCPPKCWTHFPAIFFLLASANAAPKRKENTKSFKKPAELENPPKFRKKPEAENSGKDGGLRRSLGVLPSFPLSPLDKGL